MLIGAEALVANILIYQQVRSLFGIGMGGVWGNAASMALESTSWCILIPSI